MIKESDVINIGYFSRTHGVNGELALSFESDIFDRKECPYLICKMDGILVPFFVSKHRFVSDDTALFKLDDIDSKEAAQAMVGIEVFFPENLFEDDDFESESDMGWDAFVGYSCFFKNDLLGEIESVDDKTLNTLFVIKLDARELLIPANEDFIEKVDSDKKEIHFKLIEGLLDLD